MMCISLYTSRVVLSTLGVEDYGIYNVVGGFVAMFSMISGAMVGATQRFLSFEIGKENGDLNKVFCTSVSIHIIIALYGNTNDVSYILLYDLCTIYDPIIPNIIP